MTVRVLPNGTIELEGVCGIEDAERLQEHILADSQAVVDWRACAGVHTALLQILLAARPELTGPPGGDFLRNYIDPLLKRSTSE